jgi:hypothetical protein
MGVLVRLFLLWLVFFFYPDKRMVVLGKVLRKKLGAWFGRSIGFVKEATVGVGRGDKDPPSKRMNKALDARRGPAIAPAHVKDS